MFYLPRAVGKNFILGWLMLVMVKFNCCVEHLDQIQIISPLKNDMILCFLFKRVLICDLFIHSDMTSMVAWVFKIKSLSVYLWFNQHFEDGASESHSVLVVHGLLFWSCVNAGMFVSLLLIANNTLQTVAAKDDKYFIACHFCVCNLTNSGKHGDVWKRFVLILFMSGLSGKK